MAPKVQLFELSTTGALRQRQLAQMPEETTLQRTQVAAFASDAEGWCAIDAPYFRPGQGMGKLGSSFKTGQPLEVFIELLVPPTGRAIVAAVEVLTSTEPPMGKRQLDDRVAVDFGQLLIAPIAALERRWKIGGPRCGANLLHTSDRLGTKKSTPTQLAAAVEALGAQGLRLAQEGPLMLWQLVGPISDEQLALATRTLEQLGPHVKLNVNLPHTGAQLRDALATAAAAPLVEDGETFGVVLKPGFGNGVYSWDELLAEPGVVGHRMEFVGAEV